MRITVLGKSPAWPDAGGACSGYLIEAGETSLLLDCGSGVFGKLREHVAYAEVDAVLVSHLHADHTLDLIAFASALKFGELGRAGAAPRPVVHAPPGARAAFAKLSDGGGMGPDHVEQAFEVVEYDPEGTLAIGSLEVRLAPVPHYVPSHAVDVRDASGARMTFSADTGPSDALCALAARTDLLLVEAAQARVEGDEPRGHLTPREAGEHAARAGARRLVVTHVSDERDLAAVRAEAAEAFAGPTELAREGAVYELAGRRDVQRR